MTWLKLMFRSLVVVALAAPAALAAPPGLVAWQYDGAWTRFGEWHVLDLFAVSVAIALVAVVARELWRHRRHLQHH